HHQRKRGKVSGLEVYLQPESIGEHLLCHLPELRSAGPARRRFGQHIVSLLIDPRRTTENLVIADVISIPDERLKSGVMAREVAALVGHHPGLVPGILAELNRRHLEGRTLG